MSWQQLEMEYAEKLRASTWEQRRKLYQEAYSAVSEMGKSEMPDDIQKRTAGTSPHLVNLLARLCKRTDHVLEVGCGRGYTCLKLAPHVESLVGVDVSGPALDEARELMKGSNIENVRLLLGSADELTNYFDVQTFDAVISIDVYEHLASEDASAHISGVYSILKPKGRFIIVTPNRLTGPHDITKDLFPDAKQALGFHLNETTCSELVSELRKAGFARCRSVFPLSFKLRIPLDIFYPSKCFIWIERSFPKAKGRFIVSRLVGMLSRIILIAEKS